jgi:hypothetical protein
MVSLSVNLSDLFLFCGLPFLVEWMIKMARNPNLSSFLWNPFEPIFVRGKTTVFDQNLDIVFHLVCLV